LDTLEIEQLNDIFKSWNLSLLNDHEIIRRGHKSEGYSGSGSKHGWSSGPQSYENSLVERIEDLLRSSMSGDGNSYPFSMDVHKMAEHTPHVDLTKLLWLTNVLGSTLADVMFFCGNVQLTVSTKQDSISLELTPSNPEGENRILMPKREPPIFQVIRETILGSLNLNLTYAESNGVNLSIQADRSPFSFAADHLS
jgi:hypothetical protein